MSGAALVRTAFTTDRTLEFFTESELTAQIGYARQLWPLVITKELIDNALDACETGDIAPDISISLDENSLTISDNGPGIPAEIIEKSLDYHIRVSDKKHYISPTRGQLGNALKCVWAAPFVANGTHTGLVEVSARGLRHRIEVNLDRIKQVPVIEHATDASVKNGTSVKVHWSGIASREIYAPAIFYQSCELPWALKLLIESYAAFNPQATFRFGKLHGDRWRDSLLIGDVGSLANNYSPTNFVDLGEPWPIAENAIRGGFEFVGPYFEDCWGGHGSNLNPDTHSIANPDRRRRVIDRLKKAISTTDIVFAWLNDREAYGSLRELGYAAGRVPIVAIAVSYQLRLDDFWFATEQAAAYYVAPTPSRACDYFLSDWPHIQHNKEAAITARKVIQPSRNYCPTVKQQ